MDCNIYHGRRIYDLAREIYPICRSITGSGVLQTFEIMNEYIRESGYSIMTASVSSGTEVFDWTVPPEWKITEGFIEDESGKRIIDFHEHNLHIMGYSAPVDKWCSLDELKSCIYTEKSQREVIPYVTSYYKERYGFCMSQDMLDSLTDGRYHMYIDSELFQGNLTYGETVIPGETDQEIFFSTYVCHPSMANDNCSGPALAAELIRYAASVKRKYTYRFIFIPETIGAVTYIHKNLDHMKKHIYAGFNLSCVGDDHDYSIVRSISGDTIADQVLLNVLKTRERYTDYPFIKRASDERQYNAPGVALPVVGFCRSKYGEYPQYHTSADDLDYISAEGFSGSYDVMTRCIEALENDAVYKVTVLCEPQLGKRGGKLYPTISQKGTYGRAQVLCDILAFSDGRRSLIQISDAIGVPVREMLADIDVLLDCGLLKEADQDKTAGQEDM